MGEIFFYSLCGFSDKIRKEENQETNILIFNAKRLSLHSNRMNYGKNKRAKHRNNGSQL